MRRSGTIRRAEPHACGTRAIAPAKWVCLALCTWLLAWIAGGAVAATPTVDTLPTGSLGHFVSVLAESAPQGLEHDQALALLRRGDGARSVLGVPKFGIGAPPVWLYLAIDNREQTPVRRMLVAGVSWIDHLDVTLLHDGQTRASWQAGDGDPGTLHPRASLGYVFELELAPGVNEILIRAESPDPLIVPVRLLTAQQLERLTMRMQYGYGLLYGFLLALIAYNTMLYAGLRERSHLDYALYLGTFVLLSIAYSGHGYALLWPDTVDFQQYVILVLMVLFGCAGLRFADGFLDLARNAPGVRPVMRAFCITGLGAISIAVVLQQHAAAAMVAFLFLLAFTLLMVTLGVVCVRKGQVAARYFLAAALVSMVGSAITALAVWVGLPFHETTFHAAELGLAIEGALLALALAYRMRSVHEARTNAERLSRIDPLTGLLNRRAFLEQAAPIWANAQRNQRPLSVIVLDLDFFKTINDEHGHDVGDQVLVAVANLLREQCRQGDAAVRWGGEEFVLLLPETQAPKAHVLCLRLLERMRDIRFPGITLSVPVSASFGVAEVRDHPDLDALIRDADHWLYQAKESGRGRVFGDTTPTPRQNQQAQIEETA